MALEKIGEKRQYLYLINHPRRNIVEQGLILQGGRVDGMLSFWYYDSTSDIHLFFVISKVSQIVVIKYTLIAWENNTNGKENLVLALLIGSKAVLSLSPWTMITNNFKNVLNCITSPLFILNLCSTKYVCSYYRV